MATAAAKKKGKALRAKPKTSEDTVVTKKKVESPQPVKRKATEDASPVATKKAKSAGTQSILKKPKVDAAVKKAAAATAKESKKSKKSSEKEPELEPISAGAEDQDSADGDDEEDDQDEEEQVQALMRTLGESDDDEEEAVRQSTFKTGQDVGIAPKVSAKTRKSLEASPNEGSRVIYIGHIPYGFFEHEIRQYLSQFGPITNLRLSRSKKTGASKGYAFVEFQEASTAAIVAKTMDSYLLFGRVLRCRLMARESQHEELFKGANRRFKKVPWTKLAGRQLAKPRGEADWDRKVEVEAKRRSTRASKLKTLGYEYEAPPLKPASAALASLEDAPKENGESEGEAPKAIETAPTFAAKDEKEEKPKPGTKVGAKAGGSTIEKAAESFARDSEAPKAKVVKVKKGSKGKKVKS